jgi:hypothetical protein
MGRRAWTAASLLILLAWPGLAAARPEDDPWAAFRFLIGEWVGDGEGQPGKGSGSFSLLEDLQGKVLVRRNHADLPAQGARPAIKHDDLMVIYPSDNGKATRAIYFDSEGHVIQYSVTGSDDGRKLTFVSEATPSAPRFRLIYAQRKDERVDFSLAIAPPGKPDAFKTYIEARVRRKSATPPADR